MHFQSLRYLLGKFRDERGNVAILFALMAVPLLLLTGLAIDIARVRHTESIAQAALDSAVLAGVKEYPSKMKSIAEAFYSANAAVHFGASSTPSFGLRSDGKLWGSQAVVVPTPFGSLAGIPTMTVNVSATAAASADEFCVLALAGSGAATAIRTNGAGSANLGCNIKSNSSMTCFGHNLGAPIANATGTNSGCGVTQLSNKPAVSDPYTELAGNVPTDTCAIYPKIPTVKNGVALPLGNQWHGSYTLSGNVRFCGDQQLTANTTINSPNGAVLVIYNGVLDLNGFTLKGAQGSGLTIVFAGTDNSLYSHILTGGGTLDFTAPTSGAWKGVVIYQIPTLSINVHFTAAGNSPAWNLTGLVYLPHASVTLSGAVNKSSNGASCLALVVDNIIVNGTGAIFTNNNQCAQAGLMMPHSIKMTNIVN